MIDPRTAKGDFADLCRIAADAMGGDNPALLSILEKDYWVTRVLCAIAESHADHVVFKGGTSLSKGFGLTQRFSEDIDLAVNTGDRGEAARDTLLKAIAESVADICSLPITVRQSGKGVHRAVAYAFDAIWAGGELLQPSVLLEIGTRSALVPRTTRRLTTLLAAAVPTAAAELPSCELAVLGADRTFVEKLFVVHGFVTRYLEDAEARSLVRVGRHYYDVDRLLADDTVNASVGTPAFWEMVTDCDRRSQRDFARLHRAPVEFNFAESPALFPDATTRLALAREYERDRALFFGESPSFDDVLGSLVPIRVRLSR